MKYLIIKLKYLFLFLFIHSLISCNSNPLVPRDIKIITSGLKGFVIDTLGQKLDSVKIYCLYYTSYFPQEITQSISTKKLTELTELTDFDYNLEQNFPNPFYNSTFFRFSLPTNVSVDLTIIDKITDKKVYQFSSNFPKGYFQLFMNNIVDSLQLHNGLYYYSINAKTENQIKYSDTKELFIISDKGKPNAISNNQGIYEFDYNDVFYGDTVVIKSINGNSYFQKLSNTVKLLFKKEGYKSKIIQITLFPKLLINHDVVLIQENK